MKIYKYRFYIIVVLCLCILCFSNLFHRSQPGLLKISIAQPEITSALRSRHPNFKNIQEETPRQATVPLNVASSSPKKGGTNISEVERKIDVDVATKARKRPFSMTLPPNPPTEDLSDYPLKSVETVTIAVMSAHFFGSDFSGAQPNCTLGSTKINCVYESSSYASAADGLWFHIPSMGGAAGSAGKGKQLRIGMSMESDQYYPLLKNPHFMSQFELESSYRTCSHAPVFYFDYSRHDVDKLFQPPLALAQKKPAVAYINSNCGAQSGRSTIMAKLIEMGGKGGTDVIPVHSYGACNNNMGGKHVHDKLGTIHEYKFCVAMENSITKDYVTEKLWQALEAGCVPIYYGPPNVAEQLPDPDAIIDYAKLGSPEALMKELVRLNNDPAAYEAKMAWKYKDYDELSESFRSFILRTHVFKPHSRCQICQILLKHRYKPQKYSTCLFNQTWLAGSANQPLPSS